MSVQTFSLKVQGNLNVSDSFIVHEFRCKDGNDKVLIDVDFVKDKLQAIRNHFGKAVVVTSGYRTDAYNKRVGGADNSYHKKGQAFDIQINGVTPMQVAKYAESIGVLGIIVYPSFTHIDSRTNKYFSKDAGKSSCITFDNSISASDDSKENIMEGQRHSIKFTGNGIKTDGIRGNETSMQAVRVLQVALNLDYKSNLIVDGIIGSATKNALGKHFIKRGETQYMVTACEILLLLRGYNPGGVETPGKFGKCLEECVKQYQNKNSLQSNGICAVDMFLSLIN